MRCPGPYSSNQFLAWDFFCGFLQQIGSKTKQTPVVLFKNSWITELEMWWAAHHFFIFLGDLYSGCSPIIDKIGTRLNPSNICSNYTTFSEKTRAMNNQLKQILKNTSSTTCIIPCRTITYGVSFRKMNKNARLLKGQKYFSFVSFGLYYNDFIMDISKEYFVMSPGALISTIGGFLGLFLGFSCLSVTFRTSNHTRKCVK